MTRLVIKRNGTTQPWEPFKIVSAVNKAAKRTHTSLTSDQVEDIIEHVLTELDDLASIPVDRIHTEVENALMDLRLHDIAREYITYRHSHMPDIFRERKLYRPFEYPALHKYVDAIRQSYWTHDEFNFTPDIQDFLVKMAPQEAEAVRRCMLAIAHVEATVKTFWSDIGKRLPKPEIAEVGITFGESEVRHANAYAELLNVLNLNESFSEIASNPVFKARQSYMEQALSGKTGSNRDYLKTITFFSLFIENVSLFSQFLVIMMINQKQNMLTGMSNTISATSLEENLHAMFGADIIKVVRQESPEWFDEEFNQEISTLVAQSFQAEKDIIDWIFEKGEIKAVSKTVLIEYIKNRYNKGLTDAGFPSEFEVNHSLLTETEFFDLQLNTTTHVDFFHKKSSNYTKKVSSFDENDLF